MNFPLYVTASSASPSRNSIRSMCPKLQRIGFGTERMRNFKEFARLISIFMIVRV